MQEDTPLTLHEGTLFGLHWGQIRSYCGQLTPIFFTKEMGLRNLTIGSEGLEDPDEPKFKPWRRGWVAPLAERIRRSCLPPTFADFVARLNQMEGWDTGRVDFLRELPQQGQAQGSITVSGLIPSADPIVTLGMGVPMLQKFTGITDAEATFVIQAMVVGGITENVTDEYYRQHRWEGYARFEWETYHTEEVIDRFY